MGVAYPYLAIIATAAFILIVTSVFFAYFYVMQNVRMTPQFETYSLLVPIDVGCRVEFNLRLVSGTPVRLNSVRISTDMGWIEVSSPGSFTAPNGADAVAVFDGFANNRTLTVGQTGRVIVSISDCTGLFTYGKTYSVLAFLNEGTVVSYFAVPQSQSSPREEYDYLVFQDSRGWVYVKNGRTGEIVYASKNPVDAINRAIAMTPQYGSVYIAHTVINPPYFGEIKLLGRRKIVFEYLYVNATPDSGGDIISNYYTEPFEDGTLIATIVSNGQGVWLGAAIKEPKNAYIDLRIINVSESGAYIVRPTNSKIRLHIVSTGYGRTIGMEGAVIEGGSNNYIEVLIYDAYRDGLVLLWSHDNYIVGKIRQTGRHGLVLDNSHNNFFQVSLEDIGARAGTFGDPDGCGLYIKNSNNNYGIIGLANPFYTPLKDVYIESGSGNSILVLRAASGVIDAAPGNTVQVVGR